MSRETVQLVRQALSEGRQWRAAQSRLKPPCAFVLVNNRAEGNAPLTVRGLSEILRG